MIATPGFILPDLGMAVRALLLATAGLGGMSLGLGIEPWPGAGAALAQDDDDGDDDDDAGDDDDSDDDDAGVDDDADDDDDDDDAGDDDDSAGPGGQDDDDDARPVPRRQGNGPVATRPAQVTQAAPPPVFAAGEIVVTNLGAADLSALLAQGFSVIERIPLIEVAVVLHRLRVPAGLTLPQARDAVRAQPSGATGDFNHYYRSEQSGIAPASGPSVQPVAMAAPTDCTHLNCGALDLIGWPAARDQLPDCRVTVPVGVIDTGVNAAHANLAGADIEVLRLVSEEVDPSAAVHGTAVAALLVGQSPDRAPGLIPEARLVAVDVFGRAAGDERASVASLVKALDLLSIRGARVINLSLAGPPNAALEAALQRLTGPGGAVVLAAVGNGGPGAEAAYPAGYHSVLAVTAVDQRGQIYRRAQRGPHLDFAAPGVDVWSATSVSGVKPKTGTSFAVPFATAVAAILISRSPASDPDAIATQMRGLVRDIGAPGGDEVFGAGLLSLQALCQSEILAGPLE